MKHHFKALAAPLLFPLMVLADPTPGTVEKQAVLTDGTNIDSTARSALKSALQLENVNNTTDAGKPVSTATQTALDAKAAVDGSNIDTGAERTTFRKSIRTRSLASPFWKPLKRITAYQDNARPIVLRQFSLGDSWTLNASTGLAASIGRFGQILGPSGSDKAGITSGNVKATTFFATYDKNPFEGRSINFSGAGNTIWGPGNGANRFDATGRVIVVMYERVAGGGVFRIEHESATASTFTDLQSGGANITGTWTAASGSGSLPVAGQVNTGDGAGASEFAIAFFALPNAVTTRVRCTWVSGTSNVHAIGVVGSADLEPWPGGTRQGFVDCNLGVGSARLDYFNDVPQATWNTLLGWLKPDLTFIRELTEVSAATWQAEFEELVPKLSAAYSQSALICPGSHPTDITREPTNDVLDAYQEAWCEANNALFIPLRQQFPSHAEYVAMGLGDDVHMTTATVRYAERIIWDNLSPFHYFAFDGSTGVAGGLRPMGNGVSQRDFFVTHDTSIPGQVAQIGIRNQGTGTVNYGTVMAYRALAPGGSYTWGTLGSDGNMYSFSDGVNRTIIGPSSAPTRVPGSATGLPNGAHWEFYGNNGGLVTLSLQAQASQSQNIMEGRVGATTAAGGTLKFGYSKLGIPFASLDAYANDAAADADSNLPSGGFYKITGSRAILQKP